MTEPHHHEPAPAPDREPVGPPQDAPPVATAEEPPPGTAAGAADDDDTVGTGTSIALGCIAGTLLLVVIGLIFLGILFVLG